VVRFLKETWTIPGQKNPQAKQLETQLALQAEIGDYADVLCELLFLLWNSRTVTNWSKQRIDSKDKY
jgi:hypothetical protein